MVEAGDERRWGYYDWQEVLPKYFFAIWYTLLIYGSAGVVRRPANLGTEAERVVVAVGIARHVWTLADHEPNVNLVGVVRICRYIQNFTISHSSFLVVDVLIYAYELWGWCASGNGVVLGMIS
jgi:hypothetical protein